jgi:hypothetical protein
VGGKKEETPTEADGKSKSIPFFQYLVYSSAIKIEATRSFQSSVDN